MATYTLTINGTERQVQFGSLDMRRTISGISTLTCRIQSPDASYRPQPDDEVLLYEDDGSSPTPVMFGGIVRTCREQAMVGWGSPIVTEIDCGDFSVLAQRRLVSQTLAAGTLKSQLMTVVSLLATLGITLHASQVDGPSMEPYAFDVVPANEVLDTLAGTARMVWRIDADKVLRVFEPGDESAPWHLTETNRSEHQIIGDIIVEHSRAEGYADRIIVKAGSGTALQTETITGDGSATSWPLDLPADQSYWPGQITRRAPIATSNATGEVITSTVAHGLVSGDRVTIAGHSGSTPDINGDHTVTVLSSTTFSIPVNITAGGTGGEWSQRVPVGPYEPQYGALSLWALQWDRLTNTIYQRTGATPLTNGLQLSLTYNAQYPFEVVVTGSPEGTIDKVLYAPNAFTKAAAIAAGEAELARSSATVSRVEYTTKDHGLTPGMSQSLVESYRQLNQSCFIVEIASHDSEQDRLDHRVSLISSLEYVPGWRQVYQDIGGGPGSGGGAGVATVGTGSSATENSDGVPNPRESGQTIRAVLTHSDLTSLSSTPFIALPAPGPGLAIVPVRFQVSHNFAAAYNEPVDLVFRYGTAEGPALNTAFSGAGVNDFQLRTPIDVDTLVSAAINQPLVITASALTSGIDTNLAYVSFEYYIVPATLIEAGIVLIASTEAGSSDQQTVDTSGIDTTGADAIVIIAAKWYGDSSHFKSLDGASDVLLDNKGNTYTKLEFPDPFWTEVFGLLKVYVCLNPTVGTGHTFGVSTRTSGGSLSNEFPSIAVSAWSGLGGASLAAFGDIGNYGQAMNEFSDLGGGAETSTDAGEVESLSAPALVLTAILARESSTLGSVDGSFATLGKVDYTSDHVGLSHGYLIQSAAAAVTPTWAHTSMASRLASVLVLEPGA